MVLECIRTTWRDDISRQFKRQLAGLSTLSQQPVVDGASLIPEIVEVLVSEIIRKKMMQENDKKKEEIR